MATRADSRTDVGRALRLARQRRHLDHAQAAEATRIPKRYLEALETNAPIDTYPAPLYARAFLREYATYLGLDPEPLVERFKHRNGDSGEAHVEFAVEAVPPPRRWPNRVVLALSIAVLLAIAAVGIVSANKGSLPLIGGGGHEAASPPPPSPATTQHSPQPPPPITGIHVSLKLVDRSWVRVLGDNELLFSGILYPDQDRRFSAKHDLQLRLGNAGGVHLLVNGRSRPTGAVGEVVDYSITRNNGRLHVVRS